jgi:hypothetical protein
MHAIPKSAIADPGQRPALDVHLGSLEATDSEGLTRERFLLVDDVVTKGTTLYACGQKLRQAFPEPEVAAFALMRTLGLVAEIDRVVDPCLGRISWDAERHEPRRDP